MMRKRIGLDNRTYAILSDQEQAEAWATGNHDALVESIWPFVLRIARRLAREDDQVYDELLSEAGLAIAHALKSFDPEKSKFITYAGEFLYRKMRNSAERFNRLPRVSLSAQIENNCGDPSDLGSIESREAAALVMQSLDSVCIGIEADVLRRRANGDTFRSIGADYNLTRQAIQVIEKRGMARIREAFPSLVGSIE